MCSVVVDGQQVTAAHWGKLKSLPCRHTRFLFNKDVTEGCPHTSNLSDCLGKQKDPVFQRSLVVSHSNESNYRIVNAISPPFAEKKITVVECMDGNISARVRQSRNIRKTSVKIESFKCFLACPSGVSYLLLFVFYLTFLQGFCILLCTLRDSLLYTIKRLKWTSNWYNWYYFLVLLSLCVAAVYPRSFPSSSSPVLRSLLPSLRFHLSACLSDDVAFGLITGTPTYVQLLLNK